MGKFCTKCGAPLEEYMIFCTKCGQSVPNDTSEELQTSAPAYTEPEIPSQASVPVYNEPAASQPNNTESRFEITKESLKDTIFEPISTWGFVGISLLMMLPVANLILLIVWACGGCRKVNKRNYARATLILMAISIILGIIIGVAIGYAIFEYADENMYELYRFFEYYS